MVKTKLWKILSWLENFAVSLLGVVQFKLVLIFVIWAYNHKYAANNEYLGPACSQSV